MVNYFTTIKQRVIQLIEYKKISKENFFKKIGSTSANFRGNPQKTPLNSDTIVNIISEIPDVNIEWLLTGKGSMLKPSMDTNPIDSEKNEKKNSELINKIGELENNNLHLQQIIADKSEIIDLQKQIISNFKKP